MESQLERFPRHDARVVVPHHLQTFEACVVFRVREDERSYRAIEHTLDVFDPGIFAVKVQELLEPFGVICDFVQGFGVESRFVCGIKKFLCKSEFSQHCVLHWNVAVLAARETLSFARRFLSLGMGERLDSVWLSEPKFHINIVAAEPVLHLFDDSEAPRVAFWSDIQYFAFTWNYRPFEFLFHAVPVRIRVIYQQVELRHISLLQMFGQALIASWICCSRNLLLSRAPHVAHASMCAGNPQ